MPSSQVSPPPRYVPSSLSHIPGGAFSIPTFQLVCSSIFIEFCELALSRFPLLIFIVFFFAQAKVPTSTSLHALERVDPVSLVVGSDEIHTGDSYETRIIHLFMPSCEGSYPYVLVTFHLYLALVIVSLLLIRM